MKRRFKDLSAAEVLALAISLEEDDGRIYPGVRSAVAAELSPGGGGARTSCARKKTRIGIGWWSCSARSTARRSRCCGARTCGASYGAIRSPRSVPGTCNASASTLALMELETQRFYSRAAATATDAELRQLLGDLAEVERGHEIRSGRLRPGPSAREREGSRRPRRPGNCSCCK